jgi:hypothetical protein
VRYRILLAALVSMSASRPTLAAGRRDARILFELDLTLAKITVRQGRTLVYEPDYKMPGGNQPRSNKPGAPPDKPVEIRAPILSADEAKKLAESLRSDSQASKLHPAPVTDADETIKANWELSTMLIKKGIRIAAGAFNFEVDLTLRLP